MIFLPYKKSGTTQEELIMQIRGTNLTNSIIHFFNLISNAQNTEGQ